MTESDRMTAPVAAKKPITRTFHGREFVDDYEWMRDKESQDTLDYLNAENEYTDAIADASGVTPLAETIYQEIKSRVKETDMSVPVRAGDFWYYGRTEEGKDYGYSCRVPVTEGNLWTPPVLPEDGSGLEGEQVILDVNKLAEGHEFISLGASSVTTSGRYLAYSLDTAGDERFDLYVKDLETGELLDDHLSGIFYGATWIGEEYIFYQRVDEAWRPDTVWRHKIGTPESEDVLVYREEDERYNVGVGGVRSEKYLMIESASKITTETRVLDTATPEGEFQLLWPREQGVEYSVDHAVIAGQDRWVVTHNKIGPNFSIGECGVDELPALTELRELIAHDETVRVYGVDTYRDFLVAAYRRDAIGRVALMRLNDAGYTSFAELEFEEELISVGVGAQPEWDAPVVRVTTVSFTQPAAIFNYTVATGEFVELKRQEVLGGYDASQYTAYRLWTTARDGATIPVSIIHRADLALDAPNPTLLYGYGSYESTTDPGFSVSRLSLLDRGMIFAIAHVRGGGEMGRGWYDNGKEMTKKNTFTDFIDVADDLIARGLTEPAQLVAEGGSAGGMLMGAVANLAPEKFAGILAIVPFVDSLTSMLMPELPLTVIEWDEWGDPYHDAEVYDYMASYSPYENVTAQDYPDILAITSLNDTRVLYVEPAKWIAALREKATGGQFLLKTEMAAGHGGVSGRYGQWKQTGFEYAWVLKTAGARQA